MAQAPSVPARTPRLRSGVCLALAFLGLFAIPNPAHAEPSFAFQLGYLFGTHVFSAGFLAAGAWFAFRDGGRVARTCACALALLVLGSFGFGVVRTARRELAASAAAAEKSRAHGEWHANQRAAELAQQRADAARTSAQHASLSKRLTVLARTTLGTVATADDPERAAVRDVLRAIMERTAAEETRVLAAIDRGYTYPFLDTETLLAGRDITAQRATATEQAEAVQALRDAHARLPAEFELGLASAGVTSRDAAALRTEFARVWQLGADVYRTHDAAARTYSEIIDFVDAHRVGARRLPDGSVTFPRESYDAEFRAIQARMLAAEEELGQALDAVHHAQPDS